MIANQQSKLDKLRELVKAVKDGSPTPWKVGPHQETGEYTVVDAHGSKVASDQDVACYPEGCIHTGLLEADAKLIAAAPDLARLVVELQGVVQRFEDCFAEPPPGSVGVKYLFDIGEELDKAHQEAQAALAAVEELEL